MKETAKEKLTIEQLAVYLPYGLKGKITNNPLKDEIHKLSGILYDDLANLGEGGMFGYCQRKFDSFKPILYPISMLTKEITNGGRTFIPILELFEIVFGGCYDESNTLIKHVGNKIAISTSIEKLTYYVNEQCFISESMGEEGETWNPPFNQFQLFQKLAEWHINFIGIPEELYIDKSTL